MAQTPSHNSGSESAGQETCTTAGLETGGTKTGGTKTLPDQPDLRHLKDQAKELLRAGGAATLAEAQFKIARQYGFASWPKLKRHVDQLHASGLLKQAIDLNDFDAVRALMTQNPELHRAPMGYGKNGPLTWVAECRIPWEAPGPVRLKMAQWMIDNGSDVHQGGDGPLMRAALVDHRIPDDGAAGAQWRRRERGMEWRGFPSCLRRARR